MSEIITKKFYLTSFDSENSVYSGTAQDINYAYWKNDDFARFTLVSGVSQETTIVYKFDDAYVPHNATIQSVKFAYRCGLSGSYSSNLPTKTIQIYSGNTAKGTAQNWTNSYEKTNLDCGTWTANDFSNVSIHFHFIQGTNTSQANAPKNYQIYYAELTVTYSIETYNISTYSYVDSVKVYPKKGIYFANNYQGIAGRQRLITNANTSFGNNVVNNRTKIYGIGASMYWNFDFFSIPETATINSVSCKSNFRLEGSVAHNINCRLYSGSTVKSTADRALDTNMPTNGWTFPNPGTWTVDELYEARFNVYDTVSVSQSHDDSSGITGSAGFYEGSYVTMTVNYTDGGVQNTVTSNGVLELGDAEISGPDRIYFIGLDDEKVYCNGTNITNQLVSATSSYSVSVDNDGFNVDSYNEYQSDYSVGSATATMTVTCNQPCVIGIFYDYYSYFDESNDAITINGVDEIKLTPRSDVGDYKLAYYELSPGTHTVTVHHSADYVDDDPDLSPDEDQSFLRFYIYLDPLAPLGSFKYYDVEPDSDLQIIVKNAGGLSLKQNGNWIEVNKVYKKVSGNWVEQAEDTLSTLFNTNTKYIKAN